MSDSDAKTIPNSTFVPSPSQLNLLKSYAAIRFEVRRLEYQFRLHWRWWLSRHDAYTPVFVLASHRCGSNLLIDFLNQLPGVACRGELLSPKAAIGPRHACIPPAAALRHIQLSLHALKTPIRACKLMLNHLANCQLTVDAIQAAFPAAKYIVLYRESLAAQFVSFQTALTTKQWLIRTGQEFKRSRIRIDAEEMQAYCNATRQAYDNVLGKQLLVDRAVVLSYEDLTSDPGFSIRERICPFLGIPPADPAARLQKQSTRPLAEQIDNYSEISSLLHSPLCRQKYHLPHHQSAIRRVA